MQKVSPDASVERAQTESEAIVKANGTERSAEMVRGNENRSTVLYENKISDWEKLLNAVDMDEKKLQGKVDEMILNIAAIIKEDADFQIKNAIKNISNNIVDTINTTNKKQQRFLISEAILDGLPQFREGFITKIMTEELIELCKLLIFAEKDQVMADVQDIKTTLKEYLHVKEVTNKYNKFHDIKNKYSIVNYVYRRWQRSNLRKFYHGIGLYPHEADMAINTFALVDALILTIPYSIITNIPFDFWDTLESEYSLCADKTHQFYKTFTDMNNSLSTCVYSTILAMALSCFYYVLRPSNDNVFKKWWTRGKYVVVACFALTVAGVTAVLRVFMNFIYYFSVPTEGLCDQNYNDFANYSAYVGAAVLMSSIITAIILMA